MEPIDRWVMDPKGKPITIILWNGHSNKTPNDLLLFP